MIKKFIIFIGAFFLLISMTTFSAPLNLDCKQACGKFDVSRDYNEAAAHCMDECDRCRNVDPQNIYTCTDDASPTCKCLRDSIK